MARLVVDSSALASLVQNAQVLAVLREVGDDVLEDARDNLQSMGAFDTGNLSRSGFVESDGDSIRVGFNAEYAAIVHEGEGRGRNAAPRPYLANAAAKNRGEIR